MYELYGADTFRVYEMSMGPLDVSRPWDTRAVVGAQRFLQRLWRNVVDEATGEIRISDAAPDEATLRLLHRVIDQVSEELGALRFNTAIAQMIVLNNHLTSLAAPPRVAVEALVKMVAPVAPHLAEELWLKLGHRATLAYEAFPVADPAYLVEDLVTCVVQVMGKVRARLEVAPGIEAAELERLVLAHPDVLRAVGEASIKRVIVRPPALVNLVIG
jgi:leucyl-tRNA synthetase